MGSLRGLLSIGYERDVGFALWSAAKGERFEDGAALGAAGDLEEEAKDGAAGHQEAGFVTAHCAWKNAKFFREARLRDAEALANCGNNPWYGYGITSRPGELLHRNARVIFYCGTHKLIVPHEQAVRQAQDVRGRIGD
jgi:hypothetical protein